MSPHLYQLDVSNDPGVLGRVVVTTARRGEVLSFTYSRPDESGRARIEMTVMTRHAQLLRHRLAGLVAVVNIDVAPASSA